MSKPGFTRAEPDARRQSLIEATARVLAREGASAASVRAIALEAGVSPGLIAHHFGGVDALIAATYAHVGEQVAAALDKAVADAGRDPRARLMAYVAASFAPPIADRTLLATWTAFWGLVIARGEIAALHDAQYARYRDELETLLAACGLPPTARRRAAIAIAALVDGLWLELCLSPAVLDAREAHAIAEAQITALLAA
ncbi:transcriptional regulator BetI [Sphingomonas koreensis]|uniref:transcriptional regulator BetI n=1 Tax=Sphingomonas koreensis TaxID=93064 RepID=UPI0008379EB7|nr:transcriptional regulator BetI [Sphingomonas koreensis]PJI87303.1 TetR family transcriptional regulator [Sphingomonas koreensis]RSU59496.1 transcriptional regulator BetI [Sphingomonas koreensis]RSU68651.1 transcriptional regulator BetI [Sphingomonas koreensis]